jgi:ERCC4-type nuclease
MSIRPLIIVDHAEARSGLPELLRANHCDVQAARLAEGDYLVSAAFAIERKAARDFVDSILCGRLLDQLERLASRYEYAVLLIEGDSWEGDRRLKTPMLARLYQWISLKPYLSTLYSPSTQMSARLIADLARAEQDERRALPATPAPPAPRQARTPAELLCALPGVGAANAAKLLAACGTIAGVAQAPRDELCRLIGPKRGARLHTLLTGEATGPLFESQADRRERGT